MSENRPTFKKPSLKHQPKGLSIIHEDQDIIVVNKANGLLTMGTEGEKENTAYFLLTDYVKKGNPQSKKRIFIVHRLDRDTSGVLVFAKNEQVKRYLQEEWASFSKIYYAIVHGKLEKKEGEITSYLVENAGHRIFSVDNPADGKFAKTGYKVEKESGNFSLVKINLFTGRKNQIRVHFADMGHPVAGDKMYGKKEKGINRLTLHAASLTIKHPFSKEEMTFKTELPRYFKALIK